MLRLVLPSLPPLTRCWIEYAPVHLFHETLGEPDRPGTLVLTPGLVCGEVRRLSI